MKKFREKVAEKAGFTLVELIVVIAILAILAAVAVPAYTGYIKKANIASDDAQIVVMNQAVAAAAAMNGYDVKQVNDTAVFDSDTGKATTLTAGDSSEDISGDYNNFYDGNDLDLKYYDSVEWKNGAVVGVKASDSSDGTTTP